LVAPDSNTFITFNQQLVNGGKLDEEQIIFECPGRVEFFEIREYKISGQQISDKLIFLLTHLNVWCI